MVMPVQTCYTSSLFESYVPQLHPRSQVYGS